MVEALSLVPVLRPLPLATSCGSKGEYEALMTNRRRAGKNKKGKALCVFSSGYPSETHAPKGRNQRPYGLYEVVTVIYQADGSRSPDGE
jgi:hypothetical protein